MSIFDVLFNAFSFGVWDILESIFTFSGPICLGIGVGAGGGKQEGGGGSSYGKWGSTSFAPIEKGAKTPVSALGTKNYNQMIQGIYNIIKSYTLESIKAFSPSTTAGELAQISREGMKSYEDKAAQITDTLLTTFAQAVQPDEAKSFPLDQFIESNLQEIYSKAKGVFEGDLDLDRNEIKTIVDANSATLMSGFRQQRRQIQQSLASRGIDPSSPAGQAALNQVETDIARGKEGTVRNILAQEIAARPERKMQALQTMGQTTSQATEYVGQQAQRWLQQWQQKQAATQLQLSGLTAALQGTQLGANILGNRYGMLESQMNYPINAIGQYAMPFFTEVGRQDIAAHSGASTSWGTQQSQWEGPSGWQLGGSFGVVWPAPDVNSK